MAETGLGLADLLALQKMTAPEQPAQIKTGGEVMGEGLMTAAQGIDAQSAGAGLAKGFLMGAGIQQQKKGASKREQAMNEYLAARKQWQAGIDENISKISDYVMTAKQAEMEAVQNGRAMYNAVLGLEMGDPSEFQNFIASNKNSAKLLYRDMPPEASSPTASMVTIDGAQYLQPAARLPDGNLWTGSPIPVSTLAQRFYPDLYNTRQTSLAEQKQAALDMQKTEAEIGATKALETQREASANKANGISMQTVIDADGNEIQVPVAAQNAKPMPATAVKLQNDTMEELAIANNTQADLKAVEDLVSSKQLELGLFANWISKGRNMAGISSENSRNFQSFQSTLEKLRNDSLRLNKGVQTEGDAVRAWNELLANINDEGVVKQRLGEIQAINARAADLKKLQIETLRQNYGQPQMDYSRLQGKAALGQTIAKVSTPEEYNALPAGTQYTAPDGTTRVKK